VLGWLLRIPVVVYELHGVENIGERDLEWIDRVLMDRITTHMIAIGSEFRENLIRDGVSPEKITVIRNGVDTKRFAPRGSLKVSLLNCDVPVIGCVTKMRPKKNLPLLVEAFEMVRASIPAARLVIVGDGSERRTLEAVIAEKKLGEAVQLLGLRSDIPDLLNAFDVLALSSTTEAAPLVILEAGASGLPVVSTAVGDIPEMIQHGITGFLVDSGDAQGLARHLSELLADEDLRAKMGMAARVFVEENFSIEASVRARGDLFKRLLEEHAAS
jgi:glycosyltransferase involved in cell wall biosynthesis